MEFEAQFSQWLDESLAAEVPDEVKAFAFLLWEPAEIEGSKFAVDLVGTARFDADDPQGDWACDEVWEPPAQSLPIPESYSGKSWKPCLKKLTTLARRQLASPSTATAHLKSREGIGIGFIDGDMAVIWQRDDPESPSTS